MLSIPHMIVVFVIVLVVFGPQKLPELARGLGKLMAEFRKASTDFKSAFEEEMRDLERQARIAELKKQVAAEVTTAGMQDASATLVSTSGAETKPFELSADTRLTEAPVIAPVAESVARSADQAREAAPNGEAPAVPIGSDTEATPENSTPSNSPDPIHDKHQPA